MGREPDAFRVDRANYESAEHRRGEEAEVLTEWSRLILGPIFPAKDLIPLFSVGLSEAVRGMIQIQQQQIRDMFQHQFEQLANVLGKWIESQADDVHESQIKLANRGWFPDPGMSFGELRQVAEAIETDPDAVDEHMQASLRAKLDEIEAELFRTHPNRVHLLRDAFSAHRDAMYSLSIPVLFSQADGICHDSFDKNVFIASKRKNIHREAKSEMEGLASTLSLPLLSKNLPLWVSESERDDSFEGLNRHEVLHGISVDYNTEGDSLKAVSFIRWLSWLLELRDREASEDDIAEDAS